MMSILPLIHNQRGASGTSLMLIGILVVVLADIVITVVPSYYDNFLVNRVIDQLMKDYANQDRSTDKLQSDLQTRMMLNNINLQSSYFTSTRDESNVFHIKEDYEIRKHMVGNLDVVMHFKRDFASGSSSGAAHSGS